MDTKQSVTIIDVARRAQVSAGTVSNMLTGKRPVAEETRLRIMEAIEELGYQPNLLARSLVSRFSNTLGVIAAGLEYYGPSRTLVGIEEKANELGYSLLLDLLHNPEETDVEGALDDLTSRRVDGIIWAVHEVKNNRDLDQSGAATGAATDRLPDNENAATDLDNFHRQLCRVSPGYPTPDRAGTTLHCHHHRSTYLVGSP